MRRSGRARWVWKDAGECVECLLSAHFRSRSLPSPPLCVPFLLLRPSDQIAYSLSLSSLPPFFRRLLFFASPLIPLLLLHHFSSFPLFLPSLPLSSPHPFPSLLSVHSLPSHPHLPFPSSPLPSPNAAFHPYSKEGRCSRCGRSTSLSDLCGGDGASQPHPPHSMWPMSRTGLRGGRINWERRGRESGSEKVHVSQSARVRKCIDVSVRVR